MISESSTTSKKIGLISAISIVVANMVGTGVYTSLGFQAISIKSISALILLWFLGGLVALAGSLTYGELALRYPRSGGEYNYLSHIYHPALGFLSGWISTTVGFAAPMAISSMAFASYFSNIYPGIKPVYLAVGLILLLTIVNIAGLKSGAKLQKIITIANVIMILLISIGGIYFADQQHFSFSLGMRDLQDIFSPSFAISLVFVSFAYSGWNAATYIAEDIKDPSINIPRALFWGSLIVMSLYLLLNFVFLYVAPVDLLAGKAEVAFVAANEIFGTTGGQVISVIISLGLIATVNSLLITGPRVTQVMGNDFKLLSIFASKSDNNAPVWSIVLQTVFALILIFTFSFKEIFVYIGFTLALITSLTITGIFISRLKQADGKSPAYKTWGYPFTPIFFIAVEIWMMIYILLNNFFESIAGLLTVLTGLIVYFFSTKFSNK